MHQFKPLLNLTFDEFFCNRIVATCKAGYAYHSKAPDINPVVMVYCIAYAFSCLCLLLYSFELVNPYTSLLFLWPSNKVVGAIHFYPYLSFLHFYTNIYTNFLNTSIFFIWESTMISSRYIWFCSVDFCKNYGFLTCNILWK